MHSTFRLNTQLMRHILGACSNVRGGLASLGDTLLTEITTDVVSFIKRNARFRDLTSRFHRERITGSPESRF